MSYLIDTSAPEPLAFGVTDLAEAVKQNVRVIISTRMGSCPLYREFGLDQSFIDRPVSAAKPLIVAALKEAIEKFEPRAIVQSVTFKAGSGAGSLTPIVEVEIRDE